MLELPHDSVARKQLINKWEKFQEDYFDPNMVIGKVFNQTSLVPMLPQPLATTSGPMSNSISILSGTINLECNFLSLGLLKSTRINICLILKITRWTILIGT